MMSLTLLYRIEKKRAVVPALAAAVHDAEGREVDWEYFYRLLFTLAQSLVQQKLAQHCKAVMYSVLS